MVELGEARSNSSTRRDTRTELSHASERERAGGGAPGARLLTHTSGRVALYCADTDEHNSAQLSTRSQPLHRSQRCEL